MKYLLHATAIMMTLIVSGCVVTEPSSINDIHTGVKAGVSREYVASKNMSGVIQVQVVAGTAAGQPGYLLKFRRNASFSNFAHYSTAYSFGQQLPLSFGGSKVLHCAVIGCDVMEWGDVQLTTALYQRGLQQGLQLRLIGRGDNALLNVPPEAFRQARAAAPR